MKKISILTSIIFLSAFSYVQTFAAYSELGDATSVIEEQDPVLAISGIYRFNSDYNVFPRRYILNGVSTENNNNRGIGISQDEPVAVKFLSNNEVLVTLRLTEEELGKVPEQFVMSSEEFMDLKLNYASPGNEDALYEKDSGYEDVQLANRGRVTTKPRRHGLKKDSNGRYMGGNGNCVAVVKRITGFSGTAGNGRGFANALLATKKWKRTSKLTRGAVCSWNGGSHGKGHVGWYDGKCFQPVYKDAPCGNPGRRYRRTVCVVPK